MHSNKVAQIRHDGAFQMRVYHRKQKSKRSPRYLLKCGCCDESVEIDYGNGTLEINGVLGSLDDWRSILLPLLEIEPS